MGTQPGLSRDKRNHKQTKGKVKNMGYKNIRCPHLNSEVKEFICDTDADFEALPPACTGSTAVSIESAKVMVVNTEGKWVVFGG